MSGANKKQGIEDAQKESVILTSLMNGNELVQSEAENDPRRHATKKGRPKAQRTLLARSSMEKKDRSRSVMHEGGPISDEQLEGINASLHITGGAKNSRDRSAEIVNNTHRYINYMHPGMGRTIDYSHNNYNSENGNAGKDVAGKKTSRNDSLEGLTARHITNPSKNSE